MARNDSNWIQTYSGGKFYPFDPEPQDVHLADIAHALSNVCRFAGHVREHYSIAQHSVLVSEAVPADAALWGLLHDAAEAYTGDLSRPIRQGLRISTMEGELAIFDSIERRILECIADRFGLPQVIPASVWYADNMLLAAEARDLFVTPPVDGWNKGLPAPSKEEIVPWSHEVAKHRFLRRAAELGIGVI